MTDNVQPAPRSRDIASSGNSLGPYTTPMASRNQLYNGSELFNQVLVSAHTRSSPYFSPPPPLPPVRTAPALTVSPQEVRQEESVIYRNSPYVSEAPSLEAGSGSSESGTSSTTVNRLVPAKSAFMCFSEVNGKEIVEKMGVGGKGGFVEAVAAEWRILSKQGKAYWEGMATNEKTRFAKEKKALWGAHKGPVARKLRAKKNPLAPKRPMSAFLMYAQQRRRPLQKENPDMPNADISRLLGELWRNTNMPEKRPFLEREEVERKIYKAKMEAWKNNQKLEKSLKSPSAMSGYAQKKPDQRQDVASFTREESLSSRYDPAQGSTMVSYPANTPTYTRQYQDAKNRTGSPYHEYKYVGSNCTPTHNQQEPSDVAFTYPRPQEDHY